MRAPGPFAIVLATTLGCASAQGAILDVLDGETLYDGGFLLTLGQQFARGDTLRSGSHRVADPSDAHERSRETILGIQYGLRHDLQLGLAIPWEHAAFGSSLGGGEGDGIGDVELLAKYRFLRLDGKGFATNFALLTGVSLPTGDDDQTSGGVELEPEFQPGSGSVDPLLGAAVTHEPERWRFNAATLFHLRGDTDGDGDRRGSDLVTELAVGNRFWLEPYPGPFMRLDLVARYHHESRDRMDGPLADTGGDRWTAGLNWAFRPRPSLDLQLYFELPLHEHWNGTQVGEDWTLDATFGWRF